MCRSLDPEICTIGKQLMVAFASATRPLRKPGAETVRQMPGFLRQEPGRRRRVPALAFVPEADVADTGCLGDPGQVGDRDADHAVDGVDVVELQRLDHAGDIRRSAVRPPRSRPKPQSR